MNILTTSSIRKIEKGEVGSSFGHADKMMGVEDELWVGSMSLLFIIGWKALCIDCVDCALPLCWAGVLSGCL